MGGATTLRPWEVVLTKRWLLLALALAAVVAGTAVALTLALRNEDAVALGRPVGEDGIAARASLGSQTRLFGQLLIARLDLLVDRKLLDPDEVSVDARFEPFTPEREPITSRRDYDRFTRLHYEYRIDCLTTACVPEDGRATFDLPSAHVRYKNATVQTVSWPRATIISRNREQEVDQTSRSQTGVDLPWRANVRIPPASYSVDPRLLSALLAGLALVLLLVSASLVRLAFPSATLGFRRPHRITLTPLERAIGVLELAHQKGIEREQRLALDRLARELREGGEPELAETARELAWEAELPGPDRTATLSDQVRAVIAGGTNGRS